MHDDQALEDDGPCRVAQAVREGAEDLSDACFACMGRDEDVLDILGLGGRKLLRISVSQRMDERSQQRQRSHARQYLDLRAALHALLEGAGHGARRMRQPGATGGPQETAMAVGSRAVVAVAALAALCLGQHAGAAVQEEYWRRVYQRAKGYGVGQRQHRYVVSVAGVLYV